jgi:hypothetical protein
MASSGKNNHVSKQNSVKEASQKSKPKIPDKKQNHSMKKLTLIERLDKSIEPHLNLVFYVSLFFTILFGAYLFDVKISTGGDDSHYIEMAHDFIEGRAFPTWHGPLYSIFLSLPILIFGVKVIWLKFFSFAFIVAHLVLFYFTFRKHISPTVLALVMLIVSVNSSVLYFASETYSEAMYMFLQSLIVFLFLNIYLGVLTVEEFSLKNQALYWLVLGFFIFLTSLTRNIGIVALAAMILILLFERKFKESILLAISYVIFLMPFKIYKTLVWQSDISKGSRPISEILLKNFYNPSDGYEDLSGMITRFFENARLYLSKHLMIGLGLHDPTTTDKSWLVTLLIVLLFAIALYYAFRHRNKVMLFVGVLLGSCIAATFIVLQQHWDQMRMIIIYLPMLLLFMAWGSHQLAFKKGFGFLHLLLPLMLVFIFFKTLGQTADKMKANQKVLARNIRGNMYYGFTPDWQNFLLMSEWVGKNIPDTEMVASRKPSMSFIYSKGRDFYGIYRFPAEEPEKLVTGIKKRTGELVVIPNTAFDNSVPLVLQLVFKSAVVAYAAEGNDIYGVYEIRDNDRKVVTDAFQKYKLNPFSTDSLLARMSISKQPCFAVSPDSLINTLRENKVKYVIVASLRANPNVNNGNIINTIQRYLYFVELKYPGIITLVRQIGSESGEPAWLYRIDYKNYGM